MIPESTFNLPDAGGCQVTGDETVGILEAQINDRQCNEI